MNNVNYGFSIFLLIIGSIEVLTNLFHLTRGSLEKVALSTKKQHQEIPGNLPLKHYRRKAIEMFAFGCVATISGLLGLINISIGTYLVAASLIILTLMGIIQAIIYRKSPRTWGAGFVYSIPMLVYFILI